MKKNFLTIFTITLSLFIGSCGLLDSTEESKNEAPAIKQTYIKADSNGQFKEDLTYNWVTGYRTFYADGNYIFRENIHFEDYGEDWDQDNISGEGWVTFVKEWKGTYSYDNASYLYKESLTHYKDENMDSWEELSDLSTWCATKIFTSMDWYNSYLPDESGKWIYKSYYINSDGIQVSEYKRTYTINPGTKDFIIENRNVSGEAYSGDLENVSTYGSEQVYNYSISGQYPENSTWLKSSLVTFHVYQTQTRKRSFNFYGKSWNNWEEHTEVNEYKLTIAYEGDFFFFVNEDASRTLN